jgi:hypothetical protein
MTQSPTKNGEGTLSFLPLLDEAPSASLDSNPEAVCPFELAPAFSRGTAPDYAVLIPKVYDLGPAQDAFGKTIMASYI